MKRLVVCLDGTWNSADSGDRETNVARIARAVSASSMGRGPMQLTLYLRGVGSTGSMIDRVLDGITGEGIDENIRSAYMFIVQNYVPGDQIFVFGFSRGAFTARSLCGFISSVGLLKRRSLDRVADAWAYYRAGGKRSMQDFCSTHAGAQCHDRVEIDFLGVWDTVGSLGVPGGLNSLTTKYQFHDTSPSHAGLGARHALAIDELRDEFVPTFWTAENAGDRSLDIKQVWFAGAHSDVGGGYAEGELSRIPLVWMAKEAENAGLVLDWSTLPAEPDALDATAAQHDSRRGVFAKDRVMPAYRRICESDVDVGLWGWLYIPRRRGRTLETINESVHESVRRRWDQEVRIIDADGPETGPYRPVNLPQPDGLPVARTLPASQEGLPPR